MNKKKQNQFSASIKSFRLALKLTPSPFWKSTIFSLLGGVLSLATIGSFSILVNKVVAITDIAGFQQLGISAIVVQFLPYLALLLVAYFLPYFINSWSSYFGNVFVEEFMTSITALFTKKQMSLDAATLESSVYRNKVQQGNEWGRGSIATVVSRTVATLSDLISVSIALIVLFAIDVRLGAVATAAAIPLYYIEQKYNRKLFQMRYLNTESSRIIGNRIGIFQSQYSLIELNMFNSSVKFANELQRLMSEEDIRTINILRGKNVSQILFRIYSVLCSLLAAVLIVQKGFSGVLPVGTLLFAFTAYNNFYASVSNMLQNISMIQDSTRYANIWFDIFDTQPKIASRPDALRPVFTTPPVIEFRNVSFTYPESENPALSNINLTFAPGEKTAIVGLSGAGKTTLIKLLCRVYDPTEGKILADGIPLADIDIAQWHQYLGVMFQNYGEYNVTVEESVAVGRDGAIINTDKVDWASNMAGATSFIENLPNKKQQLLWKGFKGGTELSKGEHQRLAIARILYRDALISILDEPTSSVDALTAEMIFKNLEEKIENKTIVLISHNFSTVKESQNIVVLEHGTVIEQGTHDELYAAEGRYAELYESQANAFA